MPLILSIQNKLQQYDADGILVTNSINRRYVSSFTGSAGAIIITQKKAYFLTDFRYKQQAKEQVNGFEIVFYDESGALFQNIIKLITHLRLSRLIVESDDLSYDTYKQLEKSLPVQLHPVSSFFDPIRAVKNDDELKKLRKAAHITELAFNKIIEFIEPGISELEVAYNLEFILRKLGADLKGRNMSVASGSRSALPHGRPSNKIIEKNDMILLDFGAVYEGYHSDITRTICLGKPVDELIKIHQIVLDALNLTKEQIKVGMTGQEVDAIARNYISNHGYGQYFGHGTGHGLGYEIHEKPFLSPSSTDYITENMVLTIEPGIYLPGLGGVRIEDNLIINQSKHELLTNSSRHFNVFSSNV